MMTYEYDSENNVIHLVASGVLVKEDPIAYFEALDNDKTFKPKAEERIYFLALENIAFTYKDIEEIRTAFSRFKHGEKLSNGVFLVNSDYTFGMARMIITIFEPIFSEFSVERVR